MGQKLKVIAHNFRLLKDDYGTLSFFFFCTHGNISKTIPSEKKKTSVDFEPKIISIEFSVFFLKKSKKIPKKLEELFWKDV